MIVIYCLEKVEAENCLQRKKKIHESVQKTEHEECHELLDQVGLEGHQHSQQMGHKASVGEIQGETEERGIDWRQKEMVEMNGENIWRMKR